MTYILNHKHVPQYSRQDSADVHVARHVTLPEAFDSSAAGPPIWDQGDLGSCTAHGTLRSSYYALQRHCALVGTHMPVTSLSRAFVYANTRLDSGEPISQDDGGTVQGAFDAQRRQFTVDEGQYTYTPNHFFTAPPAAIYALARRTFHSLSYKQVAQKEYDIKHAIFTGRPVAFGAQVYDSFMSEETMGTGHIPYPNIETETCQGGHCMCLVGWNNREQTFLVANSWSTNVGLPEKPGYFTMPYKYILDSGLCSDFWFCDVFY